jgi:transposase
MAAMVVEPTAFASARHFAASLGLVPRQDGTGGKVKLGPISKRGNGDLRRLLVNGAMSVLCSKRQGGSLADEIAGQQATQSRCLRARQQAGAHRLGGDDAAGRFPQPADDQSHPRPGPA